MISFLRRYQKPLFIAGIVVLLIYIFVGLGAYFFTSRDMSQAVASVGSRKIAAQPVSVSGLHKGRARQESWIAPVRLLEVSFRFRKAAVHEVDLAQRIERVGGLIERFAVLLQRFRRGVQMAGVRLGVTQ